MMDIYGKNIGDVEFRFIGLGKDALIVSCTKDGKTSLLYFIDLPEKVDEICGEALIKWYEKYGKE